MYWMTSYISPPYTYHERRHDERRAPHTSAEHAALDSRRHEARQSPSRRGAAAGCGHQVAPPREATQPRVQPGGQHPAAQRRPSRTEPREYQAHGVGPDHDERPHGATHDHRSALARAALRQRGQEERCAPDARSAQAILNSRRHRAPHPPT